MISSHSVFYHIYPLGALDALSVQEKPSAKIIELIQWIPHIKNLGCTALYLGPVFSSVFHGYDTTDYRHVDPRLGTDGDLRDVVSSFHAAGVDVVLDAVFNHTGREFFAFRDLKERGKESRYRAWYKGLDFSESGPRNDGFSYEGWAGCHDLAKLDLTDADVRSYLVETALYWIREFGIDGLRMDAADVMDRGFLRDLSSRCRAEKRGFWFLGEMVHGDYRELLDSAALDAVTNYEAYKGLWSSCNDANMHEIAYALKRQFGSGGLYEGRGLYTFLDNHDVDRISSALNDPLHVFPLHCLMFTMPGYPSVYYGSERMVNGTREHGDLALRKPFSPVQSDGTGRELEKVIGRLSGLRKRLPELASGGYEEVSVGSETLSFKRKGRDGEVVAAINSGRTDQDIRTGYPAGTRLRDELNGGEFQAGTDGTVNVSAAWARVLVRLG